jgi:hypothetical protein
MAQQPTSPASSPAGETPTSPLGETEDERVSRNWDEILQELRVTQTGTQILLAFLLTLPFQARFGDLDGEQIGIYLALVCAAAAATILAITPVALHRALFRRGAKPALVFTANLLMRLALAALALALSGAVFLIFDVVLGHTVSLVVGGTTLIVTVAMWAVLPAFLRKRRE